MSKKASKKNQPQPESQVLELQAKLDTIIALQLLQLDDDAVARWNRKDKMNIVRVLIDLGFDNTPISKLVNFEYGSVANIRSKYQKEKKA